MNGIEVEKWRHDHVFRQDRKRPGETRTFIVIAITGTMMVVEIVTGILFGSMALLADGLHMASHAAALSINAFAYIYARRQARNTSFSLGTGKVNALGGFTGAVLLAMFALLMAWESFHRLINPVEIVFNQAILVAVLGLIVNGISVFILGVHGHGNDHHHGEHDHGHEHHHDHNLRSAYLHVMADALTSVLAIAALLTAKYFGAVWMDPAMGIVGALLVGRWSLGLLRTTSAILLDRQGPASVREQITHAIESDGHSQITDLHLWSIGPNIYALMVAVVAHDPQAPHEYKARLPDGLGLVHVIVETNRSEPADAATAAAGSLPE